MKTYKTSNSKVKIEYNIDDNELILELIEVEKISRGNGLADKELTRFQEWASENSELLDIDCITLACYTQDNDTDQDRLAELYLSNGFKWDDGDLMIWKL